MEKQEISNSQSQTQDIAHCPVCNANAVQPCQQPQQDDCPRGDERK